MLLRVCPMASLPHPAPWDAINRAEEGSVCRAERSGAGKGVYVGAERSGADITSGVGALPGADEAPTLASLAKT